MFSLSKESEQDLTHGVLELVESYLEAREQTQPRLLGLISAQQVKDELGIKDKTLKRWEDNGLRRYQPPLEDTRKIFYRVSDILVFLGVENGKV
ncbi:XRE family transcriptional regulator [Streptococcus suis]|uniref:XRE family transcriptional regulator n=1 Tax=Streptococcus suis TaxID=1307 RepID=UPI003010061A